MEVDFGVVNPLFFLLIRGAVKSCKAALVGWLGGRQLYITTHASNEMCPQEHKQIDPKQYQPSF